MGGVSWTIIPKTDGDDFETAVDHSLVPQGDNWVPDAESPFEEPTKGAEDHRIERIRFSNLVGSNPVIVTVSSPSAFNVVTS